MPAGLAYYSAARTSIHYRLNRIKRSFLIDVCLNTFNMLMGVVV